MKSLKILLFLVILLFAVSCSEQKDFNSDEWKSWVESEITPSTRWLMHKNLLKENKLKGVSKDSIINLLGKPNTETIKEFHYQLGATGRGINMGTMVISFKDDTVTEVKVNEG